MRADEIIQLLKVKHAEDVFVSECKSGQSQCTSHLRMDAWVMPKSWSNPATTAYEIKVSRGDFMRDEKWHLYLPYCNRFYFICPAELIKPEEVPDQAGLMWVAKTGSRIYTKKKAPHRDVQIPEDLWRYVLMCRTEVRSEFRNEPKDERLAHWKEWLKTRQEAKDLGNQVAYHTRKYIQEVWAENGKLKVENEALAYLEKRAIELGVNPHEPIRKWEVCSAMDKISGAAPAWLERTLGQLEEAIPLLREAIKPAEKQEVTDEVATWKIQRAADQWR
jgi:hypothetical protein